MNAKENQTIHSRNTMSKKWFGFLCRFLCPNDSFDKHFKIGSKTFSD